MSKQQNITRRRFLKLSAAAGVAVSAAALPGCTPRGTADESAVKGEVPTDKMTLRTDPVSGDAVSLLGYGCMRWPRRPKEDGTGDEIDQQTVNELVDYAIAHGVNYFDTSPVYCQGMSERATGIALSRHDRKEYLLATKMSNMNSPSREASLAMYDNSFKELQTDYFDYYLVHAVGTRAAFNRRYIDNGIMDFLLAEREAGRIRNLGWSFHGKKEFFDWMMNESGIKWDFVQIQLNYFDWKYASGNNVPAEYLYGVLASKGIPAVIMEPLLGGRLATPDATTQELLKSQRPDDSCASWAFRYAGSLPDVLTILSGMTYMEHLQDNIRTFSPLEPLSPEEYTTLEQVTRAMLEYKTINCTECQYCMPCPYGIDIPAIFVHYNKCLSEDNFPSNPLAEAYSRQRRAFLVGYDRSVPRLRQASHCIGCNICTPTCPQQIDIPSQMRKIDTFVEQLKINK